MIRVLLAGHDPITRTKIHSFLSKERDISIVSECATGIETSEKLNILEPEILILDLDLPGISGFEILESVKCANIPYVIAMSKLDKYAIHAFEFNVIDYLIKPFNRYRFRDALIRVKRSLERDKRANGQIVIERSVNGPPGLMHPTVERVPIKVGRRVKMLDASVITYILADRDFTNLHMTTGETIHTSERISHLEIKLPADRFQRVQRSVILNLKYINEIHSKKGKFEFIMSSGESFMSGTLYKRELTTLVTTWNKHQLAKDIALTY
jgi:two-component system, LytTR family, response regulator